MMESVALPGGGGVKAAIKGYRIAIKTGTAKKWARTANTSTDTSLIPPASRRQVTVLPGGRHQRPAGWKYYGGAISAPVFGAIMGGVLRTMNIEPDALPTGDKSELVINKKEGSGGRS